MAPQQTATEKDMYLASAEREFQTTLRVLRAFPAAQCEMKAAPTSKSAREIAWTMARTRMVTDGIVKGELLPPPSPVPAPEKWDDVLAAYERAHREALARVEGLGEAEFNGAVRMPVGPQQLGDVRRGDALWMFLHDMIHHRGQLSVYLRMAGGKVPSIYGPSGDEPWR